jgi:hypothetical protein
MNAYGYNIYQALNTRVPIFVAMGIHGPESLLDVLDGDSEDAEEECMFHLF